jgi:methyl-accepting chemotaxis protein
MLSRVKMFWKFALVALLIPLAVIVVGGLTLKGVGTLKYEYDNLYGFMLIPIVNLDEAGARIETLRGDLLEMNLKELDAPRRAALTKDLQVNEAAISGTIDKYEKEWLTTLSPELTASLANLGKQGLQTQEADTLAQFHKSYSAYLAAREAYLSGKVSDPTGVLALAAEMKGAFGSLVKLNLDLASLSNDSAQGAIGQMRTQITEAGILVALLALLVAWGIARSVTVPMGIVVKSLRAAADGNMAGASERDMVALGVRRDELGELGRSVASLTDGYLSPMVQVADRLAGGDLTVDVTPRSAADELGTSFAAMVRNFRELVSRIAQNALQVAGASEQLAEAAEQSGSATTQVTSTIQQVAQGTATQANSTNEVTASMHTIGRRVAEIAQGVQEQAATVGTATQAVERLQSTILESERATKITAETAEQVAQAAKASAVVVQDTVAGMEAINQSTAEVADRVRDMGKRSEEIGKIVATIQDIADQTNLLALNAAIEAARAGEQGRGFAVVADEVRKLAEKSSASSREIADLVRGVQRGTEEAVRATEVGAASVARGVEGARGAGKALEGILVTAQKNSQSTENIRSSAVQVQEFARQVADALRGVAAVGDRNLAATEEMRASIADVSQAVESVAAVSEENSASVEEVSATAEELSAQVEEVSASAVQLASLAQELQAAVGVFQLEDGQAETATTGRGRASCLSSASAPYGTAAR